MTFKDITLNYGNDDFMDHLLLIQTLLINRIILRDQSYQLITKTMCANREKHVNNHRLKPCRFDVLAVSQINETPHCLRQQFAGILSQTLTPSPFN